MIKNMIRSKRIQRTQKIKLRNCGNLCFLRHCLKIWLHITLHFANCPIQIWWNLESQGQNTEGLAREAKSVLVILAVYAIARYFHAQRRSFAGGLHSWPVLDERIACKGRIRSRSAVSSQPTGLLKSKDFYILTRAPTDKPRTIALSALERSTHGRVTLGRSESPRISSE